MLEGIGIRNFILRLPTATHLELFLLPLCAYNNFGLLYHLHCHLLSSVAQGTCVISHITTSYIQRILADVICLLKGSSLNLLQFQVTEKHPDYTTTASYDPPFRKHSNCSSHHLLSALYWTGSTTFP